MKIKVQLKPGNGKLQHSFQVMTKIKLSKKTYIRNPVAVCLRIIRYEIKYKTNFSSLINFLFLRALGWLSKIFFFQFFPFFSWTKRKFKTLLQKLSQKNFDLLNAWLILSSSSSLMTNQMCTSSKFHFLIYNNKNLIRVITKIS